MARFFHNLINRIYVKNASSAPSGGGTFNRDPKAVKVKRVGYQLTNSSGGSNDFESPDVDFELIQNAINSDSYLMQGTMKFNELIFKSGWSLKAKNQQALDYVKLRLDMMSIATGTPTDILLHGIGDDFVKYHNAFLVKARGKNGQGLPPGITATPVPPAKAPVVGYFRLPPQTIQILRDQNGEIKKYRQQGNSGDSIDFNPEDIIHFKYNVPSGKAFGMPWIVPVLEDVRILRKIEELAALLIYKHLFPLMTYTVGLAEQGLYADDAEIEEVKAEIEDLPTDGILVLPERHKLDAVAIKPIDGKPYLEYFENRIFSGLGLSNVDFGRGDTANRNTADAMTGNKVDRVKGWQQSLMVQIDQYIIEELLVEGGFDPLVNPDFRVNFVFNEIELEREIAKETHEIFKFNNNAQTFEEMRINMGMDPEVDESRLRANMFGDVTISDEASNKNQPENQHGKRSGPKRPTEQIHERFYFNKLDPTLTKTPTIQHKSRNEKNEKDAFQEQFETQFNQLTQAFLIRYQELEQNVLDELQQKKATLTYPIPQPKALLSTLHFSSHQLHQYTQAYVFPFLEKGISAAYEDAKAKNIRRLQKETGQRTLLDHVQESFKMLETRLHNQLTKQFENVQSYDEALLAVKSFFAANQYKIKSLAKDILLRSYNYGYALALLSLDYKEAYIKERESCSLCQEKFQKPIILQQLSSFDEVAIFYRIPPWHPHCECRLIYQSKGGQPD